VPIADNTTEEGRQMNRRVEFKILGLEKKGKYADQQGTDQGFPTVQGPGTGLYPRGQAIGEGLLDRAEWDGKDDYFGGDY
jgi:hypothetical protein